jgi:hypothetical protein
VLPSANGFLAQVCFPFLEAAQNQDGGWGFRKGSQSRVEPTCWVLLALRERETSAKLPEDALRFLRSRQLPDGSWPATETHQTGCWVTSLACWVLAEDPESRSRVAAGARWIVNDWPAKEQVVRRMIRKLLVRAEITRQDDSLRAWGWTPATASWVEPTALALIALDQVPAVLVPAAAAGRRKLATAMLYDRMCPGGGWNCGNPRVYGVAGEPLVEPTVWALLALRNQPESEQKTQSLRWLAAAVRGILSAGSLALAKICLETYGLGWPLDATTLDHLYATNQFLGNVLVVAWACLALSPRRNWLLDHSNAHP